MIKVETQSSNFPFMPQFLVMANNIKDNFWLIIKYNMLNVKYTYVKGHLIMKIQNKRYQTSFSTWKVIFGVEKYVMEE